MLNNPKTRQQWIVDELKSSPTLSWTEMLPKYVLKWSKTKTVFNKDFKIAKQQFSDYQISLQKEKEALSIKKDLEPLKQGLKTKNERLLFYQNEVDKVEQQLRGDVKFTFLNSGKIQNSHQKDGTFVLPIQIQNELRRLIKEFQSEISKIEGDYAAKKQEHTFNQPTEIVIKGKKFADKH